jgi:hypothetical protein
MITLQVRWVARLVARSVDRFGEGACVHRRAPADEYTDGDQVWRTVPGGSDAASARVGTSAGSEVRSSAALGRDQTSFRTKPEQRTVMQKWVTRPQPLQVVGIFGQRVVKDECVCGVVVDRQRLVSECEFTRRWVAKMSDP